MPTGKNLGRLAARVAHVLLGKHKPTFTPGVEMGDYVVIVNAERVTVTGTTIEPETGYQDVSPSFGLSGRLEIGLAA